MPEKFHLALLIHAHQPCGNFEHVLEKAYASSYLPFIEHLEKHPKIHLGLHYSGPLLTWIEEHRPEYFSRLKKLVQSGQVELVGGGFYEPILVSIPPEDQHEQITRLAAYLEKHFGKLPSGAWLAERVWEPQLPSALAAASVAYTLVDDIHFLAAGFEPEELFGAYIAEDRGKTVWLYPGQKSLRYHEMVKEFGARPEILSFLRGGSWRGFFRKYPESNLLHKKMLRVSARIAAAPVHRDGAKSSDALLEARDLLLRAQCNDAYWHGIFGGIYAPHLRTDPWRNLIRAEAIADRETPGALAPRVEILDYDADGANELLFTSLEAQALVKPNDGGTIAALDFRPSAATLVNSVLRRPEAYHTRLREAAGKPATGAVASIHEQTRVKEPGLDRFLRYDPR